MPPFDHYKASSHRWLRKRIQFVSTDENTSDFAFLVMEGWMYRDTA